MADSLSQAQWASKYAEAQTTGTRATKLELAGSYDAAFQTYVAAAQACVFLLRHTSDAATKTRLRDLSRKLVERAERIKAARGAGMAPMQRNRLSVEEQDAVVERGSVVNGLKLPRWRAGDEKSSTEAAIEQPPLSPAHTASACAWAAASQALPHAPLVRSGARGHEIVQDNVSDCSVVAALIVAGEHHARFGSKLGLSCLYPQDPAGLPTRNSSGRYSARFLVNGAWRRVDIDDKLPVTATGDLMCAIDSRRSQLWPSLLEKAYLRLMGGYHFLGSNSANDLYAMTGWLPESFSLRTGFRSEQTWTRLSKGYELGKCVFTLGTGKTPDPAAIAAGLIPSHNYAVIDVRQDGSKRELVLVNPWRAIDGTSNWTAGLREALSGDEDVPGSFVVDWERVPALFSSIHVNWDSTVFDYSDSLHIAAPSPPSSASSSKLRHSTRLRLKLEPNPSTRSEVWLFLARHTDRPLAKDDFIGLSVSSVGGADDGSFVQLKLDDAYRFVADPRISTCDLLVSHEGLASSFSLTLQAFSNDKIKLVDGPAKLPYEVSLSDIWSGNTAGGNHTCHTFLHNPQFCLKLSAPPGSPGSNKGELEVVAETDKDSPVNIKVLFTGGKRVGDFADRDVLVGDATYSYSRASLRKTDVSADSYTVVVSSFQPGHSASFSLSVKSALAVQLTPIPAEGAGMYARKARGSWSEGEDGGKDEPLRNPRFGLKLTKATNVKIRLVLPSGPKPAALFLYAASASGAPESLVASTLPYEDPVCGVVTSLIRLEAREHGYLVVPSTYQAGVHVPFQILLYADAPVTFG
ncbi:hypothetical protein JCM8097_003322 [Rhodosporidiobolus ruineniae]